MDGPYARFRRLPARRPLASLALAVAACLVVGASGGVFTAMGMRGWYSSLARPSFAPPNWVFGPVWTTLFVLMGVAAWLVWREASGPTPAAARAALVAFAGQFVLNVAWSAAFFGLQSTALGLAVVVALWLAIAVTVWLFARVDRRAAALLVPYLAWVSFATYLTYGFWALN
mgnify:CR=1 FL=1